MKSEEEIKKKIREMELKFTDEIYSSSDRNKAVFLLGQLRILQWVLKDETKK